MSDDVYCEECDKVINSHELVRCERCLRDLRSYHITTKRAMDETIRDLLILLNNVDGEIDLKTVVLRSNDTGWDVIYDRGQLTCTDIYSAIATAKQIPGSRFDV